MNNIQLFLNDQLCDLSDDNPIALSFAINNLADVKNQSGNTSNNFKLPLTQRNRVILGFPDDIRITNELPYTQYSARVIQDGIEVIPEGLAECTDASDSDIGLTIISGNVDFFDQIDGKIYDMGDVTTVYGVKQPFLPYQHIWNLVNAAGSQNKTEGWIYPVINYGLLSNLPPLTVDVRQLRPAFFLHTAIELIIAQTGYKALGSMFNDPLYPKILIPFANDDFQHGTDYQRQPDEIGMLASTNTDYSKTHIDITESEGYIPFASIESDPNNQFDGLQFTAHEIFTGDILLTIPRFYFRGRLQDGYASNIDISIFLETPDGSLDVAIGNYDLSEYTRVPGTSGTGLQGYREYGNVKISGTVDFKVGYTIKVKYHFMGGRPESFIMYSGASLSIKANNQNVLFGQDVQCERIFPDISQKDLLKDTLQRFGIICQSDNTTKTIVFNSFKDIVKNIPIAKNWTLKCKNVGKSNTFKLGNYYQVNNLKYKTDDAITNGYADDVIKIDNKNLEATGDIITSQFAPSLNTSFAGANTAQIIKIDVENDGTDFTIGTSPRVLVDEKFSLFTDVGFKTVNFVDGSNTIAINDIISLPYFHKTGGAFSLMWEDKDSQPGLRSLYYKELERILTRTKKTVRYFLLTPTDIAELDLFIPIYLEQDNAYFYINKIDAWRKGVVTKIELVKIGEI